MSSKPADPPRAAAGERTSPWSITSRLVVLFTVASALLLLCAMGALYWLVIRYMDEEDNRFLADKMAVLRADLREDDGPESLRSELAARRPGEKGTYQLRVLDASGVSVAETPHMNRMLPPAIFPQAAASPSQRLGRAVTYRAENGKWFFLTSGIAEVEGHAYLIQIAQDRSAAHKFALTFRALVAGVLAGGVLTSAGMAMFVAKRGLRPLDDMAAAVERIGAQQLDARMGTAGWPKELQSLSRAFDQMLNRLEDSFARLSQFSADLAHELRTPVANLRGEAEVVLIKARTAEEYREVVESSIEDTGRLSGIIDSLLFLARADSVKAGVEARPLDARRESEALVEFYEAVAQEREVSLSCEGKGNVKADPLLFRRALSNLISNALQWTPAGGGVRIRIEENQTHADVSVCDTGCGVAPEHLPKLFDRFYRVDSSRSLQGTGLGLAIVRSIMELHSGSVSIQSEPGHGTEATLHFPK